MPLSLLMLMTILVKLCIGHTYGSHHSTQDFVRNAVQVPWNYCQSRKCKAATAALLWHARHVPAQPLEVIQSQLWDPAQSGAQHSTGLSIYYAPQLPLQACYCAVVASQPGGNTTLVFLKKLPRMSGLRANSGLAKLLGAVNASLQLQQQANVMH